MMYDPHQAQEGPQQVAQGEGVVNGATDGSGEAEQSAFVKWKAVVDANPLDFDSWVQLVAAVETDASLSIDQRRNTFETFLEEFPLCFGYWNKYAELEQKQGQPDANGVVPNPEPTEVDNRTRAVFERGVAAVGHSVEMWMNYLNYVIDKADATPSESRSILERALQCCGIDPNSGPLWEKAVSFETAQGDMERVNLMFKRSMSQPLKYLEDMFNNYNQFIIAQQLEDLTTPEELKALGGDDPTIDEGALRQRFVESIEAIKNASATVVYNCASFEALVDPTYFHVKPLRPEVIANWHAYLDYYESQPSLEAIEKLYQRCIIPCANYPEFHARFAAWLLRTKGNSAAVQAFENALSGSCKNRSQLYIEYSRLLEAIGNVPKARGELQRCLTYVAPGLVEGVIRLAELERRAGDLPAAEATFKNGLSADVGDVIRMSYARFKRRVLDDVKGAREILQPGGGYVLWCFWVALEESEGSNGDVATVFERAIKAAEEERHMDNEDVERLWARYVEWAQWSLNDIGEIRALEERERRWRAGKSLTRKRQRIEPYGLAGNKVTKVDEIANYDYNAYYAAQGYTQEGAYQQGYDAQAYNQQQPYQQQGYGYAPQQS